MDFSVDMCRVCLQSGANISIFSNNGLDQYYVQIMSCASVKISLDDGLPAALCSNCILNLNTSFNFKILCESSDVRLRSILSQYMEGKNDSEPNEKQEKMQFSDYILKTENCTLQPEITFSLEELDVSVSYNNMNNIKTELLQSQAECEVEKQKPDICTEKKVRRGSKVKNKKNNFNKTLEHESCEFCNKMFKEKLSLEKHQERCTSNPDQLTCKVCNKVFKDKYILNRHSRLHNGSKQSKPKRHMCDLCGHTFHDQYGLNMHKRCHSGQRPFVCSICGHGFSQQSNMERHIKAKHEKVRPFECTICTKVFAYSYVLTEHYKTHTGEKDHECGVCSRKFAKKFALNRHMLTHTLERPFKCKLCDRAYTQSNDLKAHIRRAHEKLDNKIQDDHMEVTNHINPIILTMNTEKVAAL